MSGSPPSPEAIEQARWYGAKGTAVAAVEVLDRLQLGPGALSVLGVRDGAGAEQRYLWIDGDVGAALVERVACGEPAGAFSFHPGPAAASSGGVERPIGADQSNTSIVVGEQLVVKLYRRLEHGPHPEIELGRHLTADGLDCVPAFAGSVEWSGHAVALVQELVAGAEDGWTWVGEAAAAGDTEPGARLGAVTSAIHSALAELGSRPVTPAEQHAWRVAAEVQLERARRLTGGGARGLLDAHRERILAELAVLEAPSPSLTMTRVHGDYHVGQVLRAPGGRLVVVDFEGEPGRPLAERSAPGTPLRDVAAMLRSFDHLARSVERDLGPGSRDRLERWVVGMRAAFTNTYGPVDRRLLRALEIEKECYEFTYAATYLPDWIYAAEGGMRWLMDDRDG